MTKPEFTEDYDEIEYLIDTDPIELGRRYRRALQELEQWHKSAASGGRA